MNEDSIHVPTFEHAAQLKKKTLGREGSAYHFADIKYIYMLEKWME